MLIPPVKPALKAAPGEERIEGRRPNKTMFLIGYLDKAIFKQNISDDKGSIFG